MDRPETPIGGPKRIFMNACAGFNESDRTRYREQLLSLRREDVLVVAEKYLSSAKQVGQAIIVPKGQNLPKGLEDFEIRKMG